MFCGKIKVFFECWRASRGGWHERTNVCCACIIWGCGCTHDGFFSLTCFCCLTARAHRHPFFCCLYGRNLYLRHWYTCHIVAGTDKACTPISCNRCVAGLSRDHRTRDLLAGNAWNLRHHITCCCLTHTHALLCVSDSMASAHHPHRAYSGA